MCNGSKYFAKRAKMCMGSKYFAKTAKLCVGCKYFAKICVREVSILQREQWNVYGK